MRKVCTIIPFKGGAHKSRLSSALSSSSRKEFSLIMLDEVLQAVKGAGLGGHCYLVSSDAEALTLATRRGAVPVREKVDAGVNAAVKVGVEAATEADIMVLPSDLPLLTSAEVRRALAMRQRQTSVVLSPSRQFDGTNLLLFSREAPIRMSYDSDSFWRHLSSAASKRIPLAVYTAKGVTFDVDTTDDFGALGKSGINRRSARFARRALGTWPS